MKSKKIPGSHVKKKPEQTTWTLSVLIELTGAINKKKNSNTYINDTIQKYKLT